MMGKLRYSSCKVPGKVGKICYMYMRLYQVSLIASAMMYEVFLYLSPRSI